MTNRASLFRLGAQGDVIQLIERLVSSNLHWDIALVYGVRASEPPRRLPWWRETGFLDRREMRKRDLGWNSDFMKELGLA